MKKSIFAGAVLLYSLLIALTGRAQQNIDVPQLVKESFTANVVNSEFERWVKVKDAYVATFKRNEVWADAYFTEDGEYKGIGKYITTSSLPIFVEQSLNANYPGFEITGLYQYESTEDGLSFYAVLKDDKKNLVVQFSPSGDVTYSRKTKTNGLKADVSDIAITKK